MAKAITDTKALELAKKHIEPNEKWTSDHHAMFIWDYFRGEGFLKGAAPEVIKKAAQDWVAIHNNGRVAYASNQAKGLADAGICRASDTAAATAEFE